MFLRNVGIYLRVDTALQPRTTSTSFHSVGLLIRRLNFSSSVFRVIYSVLTRTSGMRNHKPDIGQRSKTPSYIHA
jgi:hypothetical protein